MSLRDDISANFLDASGLVSPNPCSPTAENASNNGICYSGEYMTLQALTGQLAAVPIYINVMTNCEVTVYEGLMQRSPDNDRDMESVDDYYGLLCGLYFTGVYPFARDILKYGLKHFGSFNNLNPGHFNWTALLWRQPQLLAMNLWSAYPGNKLIKLLMFPLTLITAVIIATSCLGLQQSDGCDNWRLAWLLVQVAKRESWLCKIITTIWENRVTKVWGNMGNCYAQYYKGLPGQEHPLTTAMKSLK